MDTYENHQSFNKHLSIEGFRINTSGTKPSVYITEVKLRRAVRELADTSIEDLFDKKMSEVAINLHREKLHKKIERLLYWQLITALNIILRDGNYDAIEFVLKCKRNDKEPKQQKK